MKSEPTEEFLEKSSFSLQKASPMAATRRSFLLLIEIIRFCNLSSDFQSTRCSDDSLA